MSASPHPRLSPWTEALFPAWDALNRDPLVAQWLGGAMDSERSRATFARVAAGVADKGWGIWAVLDETGEAVGAAGLHDLDGAFGLEGVEAMWRLRTGAVGRGLVSGVMPSIFADGFARLPLDEILAFTARSNVRSQAVMQRLGLTRDEGRDFDHPDLALDHPLRPHVMYCLARPQEGQDQ
ncbi:GNAT family N-acetyltransferase [Caulobacter henricii]|uniref:GCN5 family acetyltransferase n=1 Tax=Caulobacter henricii TaxID=69395 RepID=A0A0P0P097_9CAUL|nr:GNAT family protein [Caulobacter henricii]ALL13739.1 GCN5 family acetyltransferase [Caulobacter henricii]